MHRRPHPIPSPAPLPSATSGSSRTWRARWLAATLLLWLLCGLSVSGCAAWRAAACPEQPAPPAPLQRPQVVVVDSSEIRPGAEPGTWVVTDGWMARRLQETQELDLQVCQEEKQ